MLDDEEQLVMMRRLAQWPLAGEQGIQPQGTRVGHAPAEIPVDPRLDFTFVHRNIRPRSADLRRTRRALLASHQGRRSEGVILLRRVKFVVRQFSYNSGPF